MNEQAPLHDQRQAPMVIPRKGPNLRSTLDAPPRPQAGSDFHGDGSQGHPQAARSSAGQRLGGFSLRRHGARP